ncbi:MAG: hypothetical protein U5K36_03385 [Roseovarius sp.]|nr:hypothetical protein [Roseovarius sp.]
MTAFSFNAKAALEQARKSPALPNLPNLPNRSASGGAGLGGLGGLGAIRASENEMTPEELALDLYEERAAIREFDGGQSRPRPNGLHGPRPGARLVSRSYHEWQREADDIDNPTHDELTTKGPRP